MKRVIILISLLCASIQGCVFAQKPKISDFDFFIAITLRDGVGFNDRYLNEKKTQSIPLIFYEFAIDNGIGGDGCFFAIPKIDFSLWKIEGDKSEWQREKLWENSQAKSTMAKELLFLKRDILIENFDLYVFFVKKDGMIQSGGYVTDGGQEMVDYAPKDDAIVYTYKYENGLWNEINSENIAGGIPRTFGMRVMDKILRERF